jgi:hypothetical protein
LVGDLEQLFVSDKACVPGRRLVVKVIEVKVVPQTGGKPFLHGVFSPR